VSLRFRTGRSKNANLAAQKEANPTTAALSEIAGASMSPVTKLLGGVYKGLAPATKLARALIGGTTAGVGGATYGAAAAPEGKRLEGAAVGGTLGAITGGLASIPGSTVGRSAAGAGLGAAAGGGVGALTGHAAEGAIAGGLGGGLLGLHEPVTESDRATAILRRLPPNAAQHMADIEAVAPGGSSIAGAAPRLDNPAKSRLWQALKGAGADPEAGLSAEQQTVSRLDALQEGRKAIGKQLNQIASPLEVDDELKPVLATVRKALGNQTPAPSGAEDPRIAEIQTRYKDDPKLQAIALKQIGVDPEAAGTVEAEDLADALSTLNFNLRQAEKKGVDAQGVRKYTLKQAHDALHSYLDQKFEGTDLHDLHSKYRMLSDEIRRIGPKGILTKVVDSRGNFMANTLAGKGAASVGGSISVGQSPRSAPSSINSAACSVPMTRRPARSSRRSISSRRTSRRSYFRVYSRTHRRRLRAVLAPVSAQVHSAVCCFANHFSSSRACDPVCGVYGKLLSIGNSVDNTLRSRRQTGPTKGDVISALTLALPELAPLVGRGVGAVASELTGAEALPLANEGTASLFTALMARHTAGETSDAALASLRSALPNGPVPGVRDVAQLAKPAGTVSESRTDPEALKYIMETGFAGGKNAAMVQLPASGASRAGSTATAMKSALATTKPADFRAMVAREIARRGGADRTRG